MLEGHRVKQEFFDQNTVVGIFRSLIERYLPLSQDDLSLWDADPEEYGRSGFEQCILSEYLYA
jgi:hypothetical protein